MLHQLLSSLVSFMTISQLRKFCRSERDDDYEWRFWKSWNKRIVACLKGISV